MEFHKNHVNKNENLLALIGKAGGNRLLVYAITLNLQKSSRSVGSR